MADSAPDDDSNTPDGSSASSSLSLSFVVPVGVAVFTPVFYLLFFMDDDRQREMLVAYGLPSDCLSDSYSFPPSHCVNAVVPYAIGGILCFLLAFAIKTFFLDPPNPELVKAVEEAFDKRHELVEETVAELEDTWNPDDDEIEMITFELIRGHMIDLMEITTHKREIADKGWQWTFKLLEKELRVKYEKTKEGKDVKYSDGNQLTNLLDYPYDSAFSRARQNGYAPEPEIRKRLMKLKWEAQTYLYVHGFKNVTKAFKMIMMAKQGVPWVVLQTMLTTVSACFPALSLHYRTQVFENFGEEGNQFWEASKAMVLMETLATVFGLVVRLIARKADSVIKEETEIALFDALLKMPVSWWAVQGDLDYWDRYDFWKVEEFSSQVSDFMAIPQNGLSSAVTALAYGYLIIQKSSRSLLFLVAVNVGSSALSWVIGWVRSRLSTLAMRGVIYPPCGAKSYYNALEPEYIATFLSFVRGPKELQLYKASKVSDTESSRRTSILDTIEEPVSSLVSQASNVAQYSTARTNIQNGAMGIMEAKALLDSADSFMYQAREVAGLGGEVFNKAKPLAKAYDLITLPRAIDPDKGIWPKGKTKGHIEFKDVRFSYPRRKAEVLKGVTFEVLPGDTIGMTGSAGCGKSTCMRLLERFYDVTDGAVLLDGIDIREYNPRWLRSQVATVAQEPVLLPLTIRENITFGCVGREPSLEEIYDACKAANIYDSLMDKEKFPQGLRTQIDEAGNVSGGEKQRIAIARAILADPPILLLDEATSALDEENQEKVQDALNKLMKGRTTLVIAHRLSTIKNSSKIVAFHKGKVLEEGKHDDLLQKDDSLYRKLWTKQTSTIDSGDEDEDDEAEEEEEEVVPQVVEAGMNPKPTALAELQNVLKNLSELDSDGIRRELKRVEEKLKLEQQVRETRQRGIQRFAVDQWKGQSGTPKLKDEATAGKSNFQRLAKKTMFLNAHAKVSKKLESMKEE